MAIDGHSGRCLWRTGSKPGRVATTFGGRVDAVVAEEPVLRFLARMAATESRHRAGVERGEPQWPSEATAEDDTRSLPDWLQVRYGGGYTHE